MKQGGSKAEPVQDAPVQALVDAVIVGYGPVGAVTANLLGREGLSVQVVEATAEIFDKPRAITFDHEVHRVFQWCGLGQAMADITGPHPGTDYLGVQGQLIKRFDPQPPPYLLGWPSNSAFIQPEIEVVLRQGASRYPAVRVDLSAEAVQVRHLGVVEKNQLNHKVTEYSVAPGLVALGSVAPGSVELDWRDATGGRHRTRARWLLACDGGSSFVRKQLSLPLEDLAFDEWWIVIDARADDDLPLPAKCIQYCRPSRPGTFVRGPGSLRRWEIKLLPGETPEDFREQAQVLRVLREFVDVSKLQLWRVAVYRFHALVAERWREGNVFLLGDAAHQTPPFLGQGMCAGVRDAANLVWKLGLVHRGQAPDALLDSYQTERRPHVREVIAVTKDFGLIIGELDAEAARLRDQRLGAELHSGKAEVIRQRFIPGLVDGLLHRGADGALGAAAGALFPQPMLRTDNALRSAQSAAGSSASLSASSSARMDDLLCGDGINRFVLLSQDAGLLQSLQPGRLPAALLALLQRLDVQVLLLSPVMPEQVPPGVRCVSETATMLADWLHGHAARAVLVRPDRYAYGVASDAAQLHALLASLDVQLR